MTMPDALDLARLLGHLDVRVALHPKYADWRNLRGMARAYAGKESEARIDFEAALELNPQYEAARANLAWLDACNGIEPRGLDTLAPAWQTHLRFMADLPGTQSPAVTSSNPSKLELLDGLLHAIVVEDWIAAEAARGRIAAQAPRLDALMHRIGLGPRADRAPLLEWRAVYRGNPQAMSLCQAAAEIARAAEDFDRSADLLAWGAVVSLDLCAYGMAMAVHWDAAGRESEALAMLEEAVHADPERPSALAALAHRHAVNGRHDAAIAAMESAAALAPRFADVRYELGLMYRDAERYSDAERELRAALTAQPGYVLAQLALGTLLHEQGRDAEALPLLQRVRSAGLRSTDVELRLASAHARLGHVNHARRAAARARAAARTTTAATSDQRTKSR